MKNLNHAYTDVKGQGSVYYNLNNDSLPVEDFRILAIKREEDVNELYFRRKLSDFCIDHAIPLSWENIYLHITYEKGMFTFMIIEKPPVLPGLELLLKNIDWKTLREEKLKVLETMGEIGLIYLLDHIQDVAVENGIASEEQIFGKIKFE